MSVDRVHIFWKNQHVGFIEDPKVDMFHLYGRWRQADGQLAAEFIAQFKDMGGVDVTVGRDNPILGEFTDLTDGWMEILLSWPLSHVGNSS